MMRLQPSVKCNSMEILRANILVSFSNSTSFGNQLEHYFDPNFDSINTYLNPIKKSSENIESQKKPLFRQESRGKIKRVHSGKLFLSVKKKMRKKKKVQLKIDQRVLKGFKIYPFFLRITQIRSMSHYFIMISCNLVILG